MEDQFPMIDSIVLGAGHANIIGHLPKDKITLDQVSKKMSLEKSDVGSFGLFDNSTPNYTTYYPDVTAEDLKPKDEDFIYPVFRLLSNVIVHKKHNPIEFPAKVLRASMGMLVGQTVNIDHETALGNAIGTILEVSWQESYKDKSGIIVPAGINGMLKLDGKSNPRIARGVMMEPPMIHSNSVTVRFKWEPSHLMEDMDEFWSKLGTYDEKGEMYRRIVTEVVAYSETSLVNHGADPYAKLIKNGKIVNPEMADMFYSFKAENGEEKHESKFFMIDYKNNLSELSMSAQNNVEDEEEDDSTTLDDVNNKQSKLIQMKQQLLQLCLIMGISDEATLTEENWLDTVKEKFSVLNEKAGTADTLQAKIDELTQSNETLTTENTSLKANAAIGESALKVARDEALRLYNLAKGDNVDEAMQNVIANSSYENAITFQTQFAQDTEEEFAATCSDCGSSNVTRASAKSEEEEEDNEEFAEKSDADVVANMRRMKNGVKASFIESESTKS